MVEQGSEQPINLREELAVLEPEDVGALKQAMYLIGQATGVLADIPPGMYDWHIQRKTE